MLSLALVLLPPPLPLPLSSPPILLHAVFSVFSQQADFCSCITLGQMQKVFWELLQGYFTGEANYTAGKIHRHN